MFFRCRFAGLSSSSFLDGVSFSAAVITSLGGLETTISIDSRLYVCLPKFCSYFPQTKDLSSGNLVPMVLTLAAKRLPLSRTLMESQSSVVLPAVDDDTVTQGYPHIVSRAENP